MDTKKIGTVAGASIAAFAVGATLAGGIAIATADENSQAGGNSSQQQGPRGMGHGMPGTPATAEEAQKATDAVLAQDSGAKIVDVIKLPDGNYKVHFTAGDGTFKEAQLDANFAVTSIEADDHGPGMMGGHGPRGPHGTPATTEQAQKATDAVLAQFPGATVQAVDVEEDGTFEAHFTTSDGKRKEAHLDANFAITGVEDDMGPGGPGGPGDATPASADETKKATDAVLAEYPGATVHIVVKKSDGTFDAHFLTSDGKRKEAHLDADFKIIEVTDDHGPMHGHGPMGRDVTGKAYKKAAKSAKAEVSGTVMGVSKSGKKYIVMMHKKSGTGVLVKENKNFKVTGTQQLREMMGWHQGA